MSTWTPRRGGGPGPRALRAERAGRDRREEDRDREQGASGAHDHSLRTERARSDPPHRDPSAARRLTGRVIGYEFRKRRLLRPAPPPGSRPAGAGTDLALSRGPIGEGDTIARRWHDGGRLDRGMSALALGLGLIGAMARAEDDAPSASRAPRRFALGIEGMATVATEDTGISTTAATSRARPSSCGSGWTRCSAWDRGPRCWWEGGWTTAGGPAFPRVPPGPAVRGPRLRHPGRAHPSGLRRVRAPRLRGGQPAHRAAVRLPVPHLAAARRPARLRRRPVYMKGLGWANSYPIGSDDWDHGMPLVAADRWDTGVEVRWAAESVSVATAPHPGQPSNPRVSDDNSGKQLSARLEARPVLGLVLGASAARGEYVWPRRSRRCPRVPRVLARPAGLRRRRGVLAAGTGCSAAKGS